MLYYLSFLFLHFLSFFVSSENVIRNIRPFAGNSYTFDNYVFNNRIDKPTGLSSDSNGMVFIVDQTNCVIRRYNSHPLSLQLETIVGTFVCGNHVADGTAGIMTDISKPAGIRGDSSGNLYWTELGSCLIRKLTAITTVVTTIAGTGNFSIACLLSLVYFHLIVSTLTLCIFVSCLGLCDVGTNEVVGTSTPFNSPSNVWVHPVSGDIYVADTGNSQIRKHLKSSHLIKKVAGQMAVQGSAGDDGPATLAYLSKPTDILGDTNGNLYITDAGTHSLRVIRSDGIISMFSIGLNTILTSPMSLALNPTIGKLFIASLDSGTVISTNVDASNTDIVAGKHEEMGQTDYTGTLTATQNYLTTPYGICLDATGNYLYISQLGTSEVSYVSLSGNQILPLIVATIDYDIENPTLAVINQPSGIFGDRDGNIFFTHRMNREPDSATIDVVFSVDNTFSKVRQRDGSAYYFTHPFGIWGDSIGNLFVTDPGVAVVYRIDADRFPLSFIAGKEHISSCEDNADAVNCGLTWPTGIFVDSNGIVFYADSVCSVIRRLDHNSGYQETIAGLY
jgi:DNA-binding beta-propeller fold protein YncE